LGRDREVRFTLPLGGTITIAAMLRDHHPPSRLAFTESDDRLQRAIRYSEAVVMEARSRNWMRGIRWT
jgi:hypothetical protein